MSVKVGIMMGSDSDLSVMSGAAKVLEELGVEYEMTILSAHRTPDKFIAYVRGAAGRGSDVLIAGAGGAAHLPGMAAALTQLPVVGVPIETKALGGVDSLYSIVQMPTGIPVATVAIGGAKNAAILAAKILALHDEALAGRLQAYTDNMGQQVNDKADKLEKIGYAQYLKEM